MPPDDHDERRVEVYFGPSPHTTLSKSEVGDFIVNNMGLKSPDGNPRWTEGITELVLLGMESFEEGLNDDSELWSRIEQLERELNQYQSEMERLRAASEADSGPDEVIEAAELVYRTEARILEVLCRDDHIGAKSPNYVDVMVVYKETGISPEAIGHLTEMMAMPEFGEFVGIHRYGGSIKAKSEGSFNRYCELRRLDPDDIRTENSTS